MAFKVESGKFKTVWLPIAASVAITRGKLVEFASGTIVAADSGTLPGELVGIIDKTIAATDSDYASAKLVPVVVPTEKGVVYRGTTASLVAGDIGAEVDLTDADTVNRGASSIKIAKPVGVISSTVGLFNLKVGGSY
jgi:hypothetical protein